MHATPSTDFLVWTHDRADALRRIADEQRLASRARRTRRTRRA